MLTIKRNGRFGKSDLKKEKELQQKLIKLLDEYPTTSMAFINNCTLIDSKGEHVIYGPDKTSTYFIFTGNITRHKKEKK